DAPISSEVEMCVRASVTDIIKFERFYIRSYYRRFCEVVLLTVKIVWPILLSLSLLFLYIHLAYLLYEIV
ncbi:hypothetical protein L9F63_010109, partial [Diploptera punctata]